MGEAGQEPLCKGWAAVAALQEAGLEALSLLKQQHTIKMQKWFYPAISSISQIYFLHYL